MSQEIIEVLDHICEKLGIAMDWTSQNIIPQVTDVMNRYINYNIAISAIGVCINLILIVSIIIILVKYLVGGYLKTKKEKSSTFYYDYGYSGTEINGLGIFTLAACAIIFVPCLISLSFYIPNLISWFFVPEIKILQTLQTMM